MVYDCSGIDTKEKENEKKRESAEKKKYNSLKLRSTNKIQIHTKVANHSKNEEAHFNAQCVCMVVCTMYNSVRVHCSERQQCRMQLK